MTIVTNKNSFFNTVFSSRAKNYQNNGQCVDYRPNKYIFHTLRTVEICLYNKNKS